MDTTTTALQPNTMQEPRRGDIRGAVFHTARGIARVVCPAVGGILIQYEDGTRRVVIWNDLAEVMG